jgi:hypothetical protein
MEQRGQSPHRTGKGADSAGDGRGSRNISGASGGGGAVEADAEDAVGQTTALTRTQASSLLWLLDTDLEENRDGNDMREHHRPCVQSRCAQVCALAALRGDQPDSASVPSGWSTKSEPAHPLVRVSMGPLRGTIRYGLNHRSRLDYRSRLNHCNRINHCSRLN